MSDQQGNDAAVSAIEQERSRLPGVQLAAQRQAKGWTVEHVSSQLKLATRQILALEADNYLALPGAVIVRGFVRAYGKLLGMDADALVAALPQEGVVPKAAIMPQRSLSPPFSESPLPLGNRKKLSSGLLVGGVLIAVLVSAALIVHKRGQFYDMPQFAWLKQFDRLAMTQKELSVQVGTESADVLPEVQDGLGQSQPKQGEFTLTGAVDVAQGAMSSIAEPIVSTVSAMTTPATVVGASTPPTEVPVAGDATSAAVSSPNLSSTRIDDIKVGKSKDLLRLRFREDSWIEIRRRDKSTMISRLLKAGTTEVFDITEPVILVIGNAGGVDASLRGAKLDLQNANNNNVVRLNLK